MMVPTRRLALTAVLSGLAIFAAPVFAETHDIPLFKAASNGQQQGFARIINHSDASGTVDVRAVDDTGYSPPAITIAMAANGVVHFNSNDLEQGNANKGLSGGIGTGSGDWRLTIDSGDSGLMIETLAFVRSWTGFVAPVHDVALISDTTHYIPTFNPGSNLNQQSKLRMINPGTVATRVTIDALDDRGQRSGTVSVTLEPGSALTLTSAELEAGPQQAQGAGALGDGQGKWRLYVAADQPIEVMSLLELPDGYLSNLSASRMVEGQLAEVLGRLRFGEEMNVDPIDDIDIGIPGQCAAEIEVCVRDHECEDGDEARITVNDAVVFEGELFNRWQCNVVSVNEGANSIVFLALNGTGFKGQCSHRDVNTGELRITARGGDRDLQQWRHRGGRGSSAHLNITIGPRNDNACAVSADGDDHGDTRADATDLALGGSQQGRLDHSDDLDMFRIQPTEAGTLTVYTTGDTDTIGRFADSNGTVLATNDDGGEGTNFRIEVSVSAGTYYLEVSPFDDAGSYTVHARFAADDGGTGSTDEVKFVGVALNKIATSYDGTSWEIEDAPAIHQDVAYGDGLWVAVGSGTVLISADGRNWTQTVGEDRYDRSSDFYMLKDVAYGNANWTAVGANAILTSADGRNWEAVFGDAWQDRDSNLISFTAEGVGYGDGLWVAVGINDIFESLDGRNWRALAGSEAGSCGGLSSAVVAHGDGRWYTTGYSGGNLACYRTSSGSWVPFIRAFRHHGWDIEYGGGDWVAVGNDGIATWQGGADEWYWVELSTGCCVNSVAYQDGRWVVGSSSGPYYNAGDPKQPRDWIHVPTSRTSGELLQLQGIASKP